MESLLRRIDGYCERISPEFWAEPVNAITNGAFIVAGVIAFVIAARANRLDGPVIYLSSLVIVIGIGSFLFHTFATVWAAIADSGPIMLFILTYFTISMNRFFGFGWARSAVLTLGWILALGAMAYPIRLGLAPYIGGSAAYIPAYLGLIAVGVALWRQDHAAAIWLLFAANIFAASLTFRALDLPVCADFEPGTHFLWHVLNAIVLGTLTVAVIRHGRRPA